MAELIKNIIIVFFTINAIFWSLFPHNVHCDVVTKFMSTCPSHSFHLTVGYLSFLIAVIIAQYDYLKTKF